MRAHVHRGGHRSTRYRHGERVVSVRRSRRFPAGSASAPGWSTALPNLWNSPGRPRSQRETPQAETAPTVPPKFTPPFVAAVNSVVAFEPLVTTVGYAKFQYLEACDGITARVLSIGRRAVDVVERDGVVIGGRMELAGVGEPGAVGGREGAGIRRRLDVDRSARPAGSPAGQPRLRAP